MKIRDDFLPGIISLPLFPGMTDGDVDYVCEAVREILAGGAG